MAHPQKKIILTGGGTAGHVSPNIALLPSLSAEGFDISYIGGINGIEKDLIAPHGIPYYGIAAGKLRRYADLRNVTDVFRVVKGFGDAIKIIRRIKPDAVFSKGGFVTVPVVAAARLCGVPVAIHESDITPGLANRLSFPFADKICVNFPETMAHVPQHKAVLTGTPIRASLFSGDRFAAASLCGFDPTDNEKPTLLFTGGSLGSAVINACLRAALPKLCKRYRIIHLCGKGNLAEIKRPGYAQFEYAVSELPDLYALANMVVSRAGANTIFELLALQKPNILIPLTKEASRGDQLLNAASFERQGFSMVLPEPQLTEETLAAALERLYNERRAFIARMTAQAPHTGAAEGTEKVMEVIRALI